jgi:hypothetical protein
MQLKTFAYQATINKLYYNMKGMANGDVNSAVDMICTSILTGLGHVGASHLRSVGMTKEKRKQYLDKQLSTSSILKASFSRAAYSGLIPQIADTALAALGEEQQFAPFKNSNQSNIPIVSTPTGTFVSGLIGMPKAMMHFINPNQEVTQNDMMNIANGSWLPNIVGMKNVYGRMIQNMPKKTKKIYTSDDESMWTR